MFFIQSIQTQVFESLTGFVELSQCSVLIGSIKPLLDFRKNKMRILYQDDFVDKTHTFSIYSRKRIMKSNAIDDYGRSEQHFFLPFRQIKCESHRSTLKETSFLNFVQEFTFYLLTFDGILFLRLYFALIYAIGDICHHQFIFVSSQGQTISNGTFESNF